MDYKCRDCGSERISPPVSVAGPGAPGLLRHLEARVCADCGFTELRAENALDLYLAATRDAPPGPRAAVPAIGGTAAANRQCPACGSLVPAASVRCDVCGAIPGP